jgi:hypothetical protein
MEDYRRTAARRITCSGKRIRKRREHPRQGGSLRGGKPLNPPRGLAGHLALFRLDGAGGGVNETVI